MPSTVQCVLAPMPLVVPDWERICCIDASRFWIVSSWDIPWPSAACWISCWTISVSLCRVSTSPQPQFMHMLESSEEWVRGLDDRRRQRPTAGQRLHEGEFRPRYASGPGYAVAVCCNDDAI